MWPGEKKLKDIEIDRASVETTLRSMRRALQEMEHHHPLLAATECHVRHHGLSGEDKYTFLSYELLLENERLKDLVIRRAEMEPVRIVIMPEELKPGDIQPAPAEDALLEVWKLLHKNETHAAYRTARNTLTKLGRVKEFTPGVFEEVRRG